MPFFKQFTKSHLEVVDLRSLALLLVALLAMSALQGVAVFAQGAVEVQVVKWTTAEIDGIYMKYPSHFLLRTSTPDEAYTYDIVVENLADSAEPVTILHITLENVNPPMAWAEISEPSELPLVLEPGQSATITVTVDPTTWKSPRGVEVANVHVALLASTADGDAELLRTVITVTSHTMPEAGMTPSNPFYGIKRFVESIQLLLTFDPVERAKLRLRFAEQRLAEAQAMAEKGDYDQVCKLLSDYEDELNKCLEEAESAEAQGKSVEEVQEIVYEATLVHQAVIEAVVEKAPQQAMQGLEKALEVSSHGNEVATQKLCQREAWKKCEDEHKKSLEQQKQKCEEMKQKWKEVVEESGAKQSMEKLCEQWKQMKEEEFRSYSKKRE